MAYPEALLSSRSVEWPTPKTFYQRLHKEFGFTLDPCATKANAKCARFYTINDDGLSKDWGQHRVFCNPPYGRPLRHWIEKAIQASSKGALVVMLLPASTGTKWFHELVLGKAELRFVKGRLQFGDAGMSAPFSSVVAVYRPTTCGARIRMDTVSAMKAA